jgi:hypothetical protein
LVTDEFGQPVERFGQQVRSRVGQAIPVGVFGRALEAEVGAEIDDPGAGFQGGHGRGGTGAVGQA